MESYVPPKHRVLLEKHGIVSQKTTSSIVATVIISYERAFYDPTQDGKSSIPEMVMKQFLRHQVQAKSGTKEAAYSLGCISSL
jgi:hypothetical protein